MPRTAGTSSNSSRSLTRPRIAKRPAIWRWSSASMDTAQRGCRSSTSSMREPVRTLTRISGGSSETDSTAVAVMPASSPATPSSGSNAVTSVTPPARRAMAARKASGAACGSLSAGSGASAASGTT